MYITALMILDRAIQKSGLFEALFCELSVEEKQKYYYQALRELLAEASQESAWEMNKRQIIQSALMSMKCLMQASKIIWELWMIARHSIFTIDNIVTLAQAPITVEAINQTVDVTEGISQKQLTDANISVSDIFDIIKGYNVTLKMDGIEYSSEPEPKSKGMGLSM